LTRQIDVAGENTLAKSFAVNGVARLLAGVDG
jgi:hypothetical protein